MVTVSGVCRPFVEKPDAMVLRASSQATWLAFKNEPFWQYPCYQTFMGREEGIVGVQKFITLRPDILWRVVKFLAPYAPDCVHAKYYLCGNTPFAEIKAPARKDWYEWLTWLSWTRTGWEGALTVYEPGLTDAEIVLKNLATVLPGHNPVYPSDVKHLGLKDVTGLLGALRDGSHKGSDSVQYRSNRVLDELRDL